MATLFNALTRQPLFHWGGGISFFSPIVIPAVHKLRAAGWKKCPPKWFMPKNLIQHPKTKQSSDSARKKTKILPPKKRKKSKDGAFSFDKESLLFGPTDPKVLDLSWHSDSQVFYSSEEVIAFSISIRLLSTALSFPFSLGAGKKISANNWTFMQAESR